MHSHKFEKLCYVMLSYILYVFCIFPRNRILVIIVYFSLSSYLDLGFFILCFSIALKMLEALKYVYFACV